MTSPVVDAQAMLALSMRIGCCGILIQSLEVLWNWREFPNRRLFGWRVFDESPATRAIRMSRLLHRPPACLWILVARAAAAGACLVLPYGAPPVFWLVAFLFLGQFYYNRRYLDIVSNADTMFLICLAALAAGALPKASPDLKFAALAFLTLQVMLAYFGTGKNKASTPTWRNGARLTQIAQYGAHRFVPLGGLFIRRPRVAAFASWTVILLQLLFPISIFLPSIGFWIFIAAGVIFHASVAFTMGLHDFMWSFTATYPALYFVHTRLAPVLYG